MSGAARPTTERDVDARTETRLRELDRRAAATTQDLSALAVRSRHVWTTITEIPPGGILTTLTGWVAASAGDDAAEHLGAGVFRLRRPGVWALAASMASGGADAGNAAVVLRIGTFDTADGGYVGTGFPGAGFQYLRAAVVEPFAEADINVDVSALAHWFTAGLAARAVSCRMELHLLAGDPDSTASASTSGSTATPASTPTTTSTTTPATTSTPSTSTSTSTSTSSSPTSTPSTNTTSTPAPSPDDGVQTAVTRDWGAPVDGDEFAYTGAPISSKWALYDGPGHAGNGIRSPSAFSVANGILTCYGDAAGTTGGAEFKRNEKYCRIEVRARTGSINPAAAGHEYHPVLLTWPQSERWPQDGENDFFETDTDTGKLGWFIHIPGNDGSAQRGGTQDLDIEKWHNYAFEWDQAGTRGWVDGVKYFDYPGIQPPGPMHLCVQLDAFYPSGMRPAKLEVMWVRIYAKPS